MRCLLRNARPFYYATFKKLTAILDSINNETGESKVEYNDPVECLGNISAARGSTDVDQFGENENYDRVIVMDDPDTPIDEYSVLWVDTLPTLNSNGSLATTQGGDIATPWDYVVRRVARSLNSVSIAISKVKVR